ncbi:MAG TPA: formylglycine-generating enzyme family protein [Polyangiaceae bacterium]|nr:formylglycine-generating enzyme family protein [Polyangiaceae bacterium]
MTSIAGTRIAGGILWCALLWFASCKREGANSQNTMASGRASAGLVTPAREQAWGGSAPSCKGLPAECGISGKEDCCKSLRVPGGTYYRSYDGVDHLDKGFRATLSDFYLDKYEVTVGRLRAFVDAGKGTQKSPPAAGAGAHPKIAASGWRSEWTARLSEDTGALKTALRCYDSYQTWTDAPADNEKKAANCVDWYTAFAFCVWDGGRIATEAEWMYAAAGGDEQRYYPWSSPPNSTAIDDSYAAYCGGTCWSMQDVGMKPKGDGKWGHSDLGGNAWEWTLDWNSNAVPVPCHDCAVVDGGTWRNARSGAYNDLASTLRSATRHVYSPDYHGIIGLRCARNP